MFFFKVGVVFFLGYAVNNWISTKSASPCVLECDLLMGYV